MVKARDRIGLQMFPSQHDGIHWAKWKASGARYMEAAVVVGPPPAVNLVAVAKIPYGVDEYTIAGAMCGTLVHANRGERLLVATIDRRRISAARRRFSYLAERRPEAYGQLLERT